MTGDLQINATTAGTVVGTYWFLMLVGRLTGGVLGSKFSSKSMLSFTSSSRIGICTFSNLLTKRPNGKYACFSNLIFLSD